MPSLNIFHIEFDRSDAVYIPGEIVSGCVIIDLEREKLAEALKLSTKGKANVRWQEHRRSTDSRGNSTTSTRTYSKDEDYFKLSISLLERSEDDGKVHLPAGLSRYSFNIQIPYELPCSFEHRYGHVRYTVKAIIVRSWRFNHECKAAFTIITSYDLNIRREQCIGIYDEVNQAFSCLCCFSNGLINMHVKLPMTGFVPGQWIEAILDIRNTSNAELQKICFKLQQAFEFHATTSTKHEKTTVVADKKLGPFDKHTIVPLRLLIPPVPPSELEFCNIIDIKYILRIVLHSTKMFHKIVKEYPILIGTIPLRPVSSAPAAPSSSHASQSTSTNENVIPNSDIIPSAPHPSSSSMNEYFDVPPSYEECCTHRASCIKDPKESIYVYGANEPFAPKYPVFKFPKLYPPEQDPN